MSVVHSHLDAVEKTLIEANARNVLLLIGFWDIHRAGRDAAIAAAQRVARDLTDVVLFSGGDISESFDPLLGEVVRTLLDTTARDHVKLHVAFQHHRHRGLKLRYPSPTILCSHKDKVDGKAFYSGLLPDGSVGGALRNMLDVCRRMCDRGHHINTTALFLGGGAISRSEMTAILDCGERGELHGTWCVMVAPIGGEKGRENQPLDTLREREGGLRRWHAATSCRDRAAISELVLLQAP